MKDFLESIRRCGAYAPVLDDLRVRRRAQAEGLWGSSSALLLSALAEDLGGTGLCILPGVEEAERFAEDVRLFAGDRMTYFPAWEVLDADDQPDLDIASERLLLLRQLLEPEGPRTPGGRLIVAPVAAVLQHAATAEELRAHTLQLGRGAEMPPERIADWLVGQGFRAVHQVEVPGEFCRRGGILDVFSFAAGLPVRIEFFGDVVDSIRTFDPMRQASENVLERCEILAASGVRESTLSARRTIVDALPEGSWVALKEPAEVAARADAPDTGIEAGGGGPRRLMEACARLPLLDVSAMPLGPGARAFDVRSVARFSGPLASALKELADLCARTRRTVVLCNNEAERQRLSELLRDLPSSAEGASRGRSGPEGAPAAPAARQAPPAPELLIGRLNAGFEVPEIGLALVPHHELFHRYQQRRTLPRYRHTGLVAAAAADLNVGDTVVHVHHGIGIYRGMRLMKDASGDGAERERGVQECLCVEYRDGAMLYVPVSHIELLQRYVGPFEQRPELSRLGGRTWTQQKARAAEAAERLALDLLATQAERVSRSGTAFADDPEWQGEFEAAFIYEETEDQLRVAEEVRRDMASERPMDRLLCGDVGYGKTEIAMRAAFRAVSNGAQAAVLVPTTVLAAQHFHTFRERMADYPVRIEMLSRFRTRAEQKAILDRLEQGEVDIVIGTHRLVQDDVRFRNLGLVIIDEEQRFGVEHKERLKRFRSTVDVLTLTATPIPRTLHMALLGIRDISSLQTPPRDRLAIQTQLIRFDEEKLRRIIRRELARDGQVFFVHNRVENIEAVAARVQRIVPEARVAVAHGQMSERRLEERMRRFVAREADVLVCTTIIESGLDIPNANTIIINRADEFGLADLHQLRGRVGRYRHRAYAYLVLPEDRPVNPLAQKRLKAIQEFSELGAGFKIAMRDLELRGAGNLLGPEQSGHIAAVGYDLYCRLLEWAVRKGQGRPVEEQRPVAISLGLEAYLPEDYMPDPRHRIEVYRRLVSAASEETLEQIGAELRDRFGPLPRAARLLLEESVVRLRARQVGIRRIRVEDHQIHLTTDRLRATVEALRCSPKRCVQLDEHTILVNLPRGREIPPEEYLLYLKNVLLPTPAPEAVK